MAHASRSIVAPTYENEQSREQLQKLAHGMGSNAQREALAFPNSSAAMCKCYVEKQRAMKTCPRVLSREQPRQGVGTAVEVTSSCHVPVCEAKRAGCTS